MRPHGRRVPAPRAPWEEGPSISGAPWEEGPGVEGPMGGGSQHRGPCRRKVPAEVIQQPHRVAWAGNSAFVKPKRGQEAACLFPGG